MKWRSLQASHPEAVPASLKQQLAERKAGIRQYSLPESIAINERAVEELRQSGMAERVLATGAQTPFFELPDHDGRLVSSASLLQQGRLVICFYRGRWCPFCVAQLEAMNAALPQIQAAGASLVAISPQTVRQSYFMHDQHRLGFPLLSDAGNGVARQFGLVYRVPDYQQQLYSKSFVNLPFANGDASWELPIPATYVLKRDGKVLYASASVDYSERPEPAEVVQAVSR